MKTVTDTKSTITLFGRANPQLQNTVFQHNHHHELCIFARDEQESACHASAEVTHCCSYHCWNTPPTASLCSHPLFGLLKHSASISKCQWVPFFPIWWRNSIPHHCFIHASMSDTTVSDCPSASICHMATTCNGMWVGRFCLCCHITSIHLWPCGPT